MKINHYFLLLRNILTEILLQILSIIIVPIALLFCNKESEHLPKWARWFEDAHDTYDGRIAAINGDAGWIKDHYPEPKNRTYIARLKWLFRNRIGYFSSRVIGTKVSEIIPESIKIKGIPTVTNNKGLKTEYCLVTCKLRNGSSRFGFYKEIRYSKNYYIRIYLGWKLLDITNIKTQEDLDKYLQNKEHKKYLKTVSAINPFKRVRQN